MDSPLSRDEFLTLAAQDAARTGKGWQEMNRFTSAILDALPTHLAILDEEGTIVSVNRAWRDFAAANSGAASIDILCEGANYLSICIDARGPWSEEAAAVAAGITSVLGGQQNEFTIEYPCHSPGEERWFSVRVTRLNSDGQPYVVVAHEVITKRKRTEDSLRESEVKLRTLIDTLPDLVWLKDTEATGARTASSFRQP